ncbi:Peroxisomal membrane 22 kDa (Mpv17/PMP22) family protein isoform 1 [Hibiscus syriacus]|uniref:Peroxisomal membrane 22 kDa (Mpv17/PMP22) family protein isoform 1 n=1 Tax=Hibiscus syriacus TaxID=106335 RepID=A0A6A2XHA5_HIBSY|nr:Peroxisomal membrane 22 kDa (Mpv17/PMP22) family protein isoform 1 [Hibiscus syriacus]
MASLQASNFLLSFSSNKIHAAISVPKFPLIRLSAPKLQPKITGGGFINTIPIAKMVNETPLLQESSSLSNSMATLRQLYAILEAVADRVEMHQNLGEQRDNWNSLLLNSINMMTLTATTMAGVAASTGGDGGSEVAGRRATKCHEIVYAAGKPNKNPSCCWITSQEDVYCAMEKVLALDKAYPLPLLGVMLEKYPETFQPAVWWPRNKAKRVNGEMKSNINGWTKELEMEMKEVVEVIKKKDTLMACSNNPWAETVAAVAGALASTVNTLEHGGQVGMVFEMYRNNAGFFKLVQESIESTLDESDLERRETGSCLK